MHRLLTFSRYSYLPNTAAPTIRPMMNRNVYLLKINVATVHSDHVRLNNEDYPRPGIFSQRIQDPFL